MKIRLHAFEPASRANGPGLRAVVWLQGCTLRCPGCFNPCTHDPRGGYESDTEQVAAELVALVGSIEGVSISGGEPFQQPEALLDLVDRLTEASLSRLVFSGYRLPEIESMRLGPTILERIDVLIAGRYDPSQPTRRGLCGSANQQVHCLTSRYSASDLLCVPWREVILKADGTIVASGALQWHR